MKVVFIPDQRNTNIYQSNLADSLSRLGVHVSFNGSIWSILKIWPDVLHIHWTYPFMKGDSRVSTILRSTKFIFGLSILRLLGIKIIWTVHNIVDHEGKYNDIEIFFNKLLTKVCNRLIVHCQSVKTDIAKMFDKDESSVIVIPHGNYIGYYQNTITSSQAREKLELSENDKVFLYFGQIRSYKGVPELIDTFRILSYQNIKLLIVGKPLNYDVGANILTHCGNDVRIKVILKFIPDEDIQIYMNAADIVVLPYKDILTSGTVVLSMSFGKTVIAPAVRCIADILDNKVNFLYSKNGSLLEEMERALNTDRLTLENMGKINLKGAEQFSWDKIAERTYNAYAE